MRNSRLVAWIIILVILADQFIKIWVKTHMTYGEEIPIFGSTHAIIRFEENDGMAFNFKFGGPYGKLILSLFRILAMGLLAYYLKVLLKEGAAKRMLIGFSLVLAGAIGNIIDSAFYGMVFSASSPHGGVASFLPEGGGYAPFLHGWVVDMFYFPISTGTYPDWIPFIGGNVFHFFRPIFNLADVAICIGVILLLLQFVYSLRKPGISDSEQQVVVAAKVESEEE